MVRINFVGDIALFKEFQRKGIDPFKEINLPESDYNIGNLEFIIPNNREKRFFDVHEEYRVDYEYFSNLNIKKFQALSLANNHAMDYGDEGVKDVLEVLESQGVSVFGIGTKPFSVLEFSIQNISFAIIGCVKKGRWISQEGLSPDLYDAELILKEIKKAKQRADHVLVFPHMGTELVDIPSPADVDIARLFIDGGASAVIGHHPHILQGIETYKKGIIAYSLGSFIYLPKFELGYKENQNKEREYSLCLSVTFSKNEVIKTDAHYYKLDHSSLIPLPYYDKNEYFTKLNEWIGQPKLYYKKIRKQLIKREIVSFLLRLRKDPLKTIKHYIAYIKPRHFKAIIKKG